MFIHAWKIHIIMKTSNQTMKIYVHQSAMKVVTSNEWRRVTICEARKNAQNTKSQLSLQFYFINNLKEIIMR